MASPFFSSYWNQPSESRYSPSSVPVKRKPDTPSPKVVSIPVHFVDSKNIRINSGYNRSDSALRIQKVFRGFLLRRSVNKIVSIKDEVEEIERRIAKKETVELIRKDSKERLRINETLMALLFKLDSVRGIDSGVRELRKGVIKKAIALQERVDALVMLPPESPSQENQATVDSGHVVDDPPVCDDDMPIENLHVDISNDNMVIENDEMPIEIPPAAIETNNMPVENEEMPIENVIDSMDNDEEEGSCVVKEIVEECNTMNSRAEIQKQDEEMDDCSKGVQQQAKEDTREVSTVSEEGGEKKSNEELQTQMIRMMSELVEKNELQTRMINSLTHRVGQLEKAFLCDKLRRSNKKKKRQHDAVADGKRQ